MDQLVQVVPSTNDVAVPAQEEVSYVDTLLAADLTKVTTRVNTFRIATKSGKKRKVTNVAKTTRVRDALVQLELGAPATTKTLRAAAKMDRSKLGPAEAKVLRDIGSKANLTPASVAATIVALEGGTLRA